eukprot:gene8847-10484_t
MGYFQAPELTTAHKWVGWAGVLGAIHVVLHVNTVIVTCAESGFGWGVAAWNFDIMGWLASCLFAFLCRKSSSTRSSEAKKDNRWIAIWAFVTLGVRVLDTLMLVGLVKIPAIYHTPANATLVANIVSEIVFGNLFVGAALVGSLMLLCCPTDMESQTVNAKEREESVV